MDLSDEITISRREYDELQKNRQMVATLKSKLVRMEKDLAFHVLTAENLQKIRDLNDKQRDEYYLYNILLLKNCPGMLLLLDLNLNFVLGSEVAIKRLKYEGVSSLVGKTLREILSHVVKDISIVRLEEFCKHVLSTLKSVHITRDVNILDVDTDSKIVIEISPALDDEGKCYGVVIVLNDVTELYSERNKAIRASQAKSLFLANMSHDIRTPMNAVIGMAELLSLSPLTATQREYVNDILTSSTSLLGLLNDILDLSKIEEGQLKIQYVEFHLNNMLENINSMFKHSANQKHIDYRFTGKSPIPDYVYGDDVRIKQILVNIIGNAIKFTNTGTVFVDVSHENDRICFEVTDTGIGIKENDIPRIFEAFNQLHEDAYRHIKGTGLGLSITKNLVQLMNGTLSVKSVYGQGSTFRIELPLPAISKTDEVLEARAEFKFIEAPTADILVVDDNLINLKVAKNLLGLCKIDIDMATSGKQAIDMIGKKHYDIVFLDHMMPDLDGVETSNILRSCGYTPEKLIIIALSANAVEGARQMFLSNGMQDFLVKPIDKVLLNEMLKKWLPPEKVIIPPYGDSPERSAKSKIEQIGKISGLDVTGVLKKIGGNEALYGQYVNALMNNLSLMQSSLLNYLNEPAKLATTAHGFFILLQNVGASHLAELASELEKHSRVGEIEKCGELSRIFLDELHELSSEIKGALEITDR